MRNGLHLFERLFLISWENNRDCYITMPLSLKTREVQIKGDQWKKMFRTVRVYWGRHLVAIGPFEKGLILGDPGAVSRVWKRGQRKFSRTNERAPGMLLLTDQFHDSSERFSVIGHKNTIWRSSQIYRTAFVIFLYEGVYRSPYLSGSARRAFFGKSFGENGVQKNKENSIICKISVQPYSLIMHTTISYYFVQIVDLNRLECIINVWGYTEVLPHNLAC